MDKYMNLQFFADGGAPAAGGEGTGQAVATAEAGQTQRATKYRGVTNFAQQPQAPKAEPKAEPQAVASKEQTEAAPAAPEKKPFQELIKGDYKGDFQAEVDRIINRRFAENKAQQEQNAAHQAFLDELCADYKVKPGDLEGLKKAREAERNDEERLELEAAKQGKTVEEYKRTMELDRREARMNAESERQKQATVESLRQQQITAIHTKWQQEAEALKKVYPGFDFEAERTANGGKNDFAALIGAGVPVELAFETAHRKEISAGQIQLAHQKAKEEISKSIQSGASRPVENGGGAQAPASQEFDYSKLSRKAKDEIERRASRGEKVNPRDYMNWTG